VRVRSNNNERIIAVQGASESAEGVARSNRFCGSKVRRRCHRAGRKKSLRTLRRYFRAGARLAPAIVNPSSYSSA